MYMYMVLHCAYSLCMCWTWKRHVHSCIYCALFYLMVNSRSGESNIDGERWRVVVRSETALALGMILHHKVHEGTTLTVEACITLMCKTEQRHTLIKWHVTAVWHRLTHLWIVAREHLDLNRNHIALDHLQPLLFKTNLNREKLLDLQTLDDTKNDKNDSPVCRWVA